MAKQMKRQFLLIFLGLIFILSSKIYAEESLLIFAGEANIPFLEKIKPIFEKKEKIKLDISYGGSGVVMSQILLSKRGDIFIPGSEDYMEKAKEKGIVIEESIKSVAFLVPVIVTKKGNPKKISKLSDLLQKDVKIVIGNPENVCLGAYGVEIFEKNFTQSELKKIKEKIINYAGGCEKVHLAVRLGQADVAIGWHNFENIGGVDIIKLKPNQIKRISFIPASIVSYTKKKALAERFINFLLSDEAKEILKKEGYFVTKEEATKFINE